MSHLKIALIDPLSLRGRQAVELLPHFVGLGERFLYFNTSPDEDHEVANIGGSPALVHPLDVEGELKECGAVLVASDRTTEKTDGLVKYLREHPDVDIVDMSRVDELRALGVPADAPDPAAGSPSRLRVPHPSLIAAVNVLRPLDDLGPVRLVVNAIEPASELGADAVSTLARQATARLSGQPPGERIEDEILAFSCVSLPSGELLEDARLLLPDLQVTATLSIAGWFHGHLTTLGITFDRSIAEHELRDRWSSHPRLTMVGDPLRLDTVTDRQTVFMATPQLSSDHRTVAVTTMVDGLVLGGALTALELLRGLT